jgi:hypothetical protein
MSASIKSEQSSNSSFADISKRWADVRFTPESGHGTARSECPLCASSGHWRGYSITSSAVPSSGSGDAERLGSLEVGDHHCLLNGQVSRLCKFKSLEFRNRTVTHAVMIGKSDFEQVPKEFDLNQGIDGRHWGMSALAPKADIAPAGFY